MEQSSFESYTFNPKLKRRIEIIELVIALVLVALSLLSILGYNSFKQQFAQSIAFYGPMGLFITTLFVELIPQIMNPYIGIIVAVASGINIFTIAIIAILGSLCGSIIGFELGRKYGFRLVIRMFEKSKLEKILNFWKKWGNIFVFLAALTPLPFVSLIFGALKMSREDFAIYGLIPRVTSLILVCYLSYLGFV